MFQTRRADESDPRILAEQVAMLYRMAPHAIALSAFGSTVILCLFLTVAPTGPLVAWYVALLAMYAVRYVLIRAYRRAAPPQELARRWGRYFTLSMVCSGALWGLLG